jgi:hypothetical protein
MVCPINDARSLNPTPAPAQLVVIVATRHRDELRYRVVIDEETTLDDVFDPTADAVSFGFIERSAFDDDAQLLAELLADRGWITLDQVLERISCARGARRGQRRREERGQ